MPISRRLCVSTRFRPPGHLIQIINFAALVTVIFFCTRTGFPVYISTGSGSFEEVDELPALFNLDTNLDGLVTLPLHSHDSISRQSSIGFMSDSGTSEDLTRVQQPRCLLYPPTLQGVYGVNVKPSSMPDSRLEALSRVVQKGGWWKPPGCRARQRLAVIIPYRDRARHLRLLLSYLHPFLQRQLRHYQIFVVEQAYNETFNKGMIMNVAFTEVMRRGRWDCIIFHDVDMIPENDRNIYECMRHPRHLSPGVDVLRYVLMYDDLVGGALALTPTQVVRSNGYSNLYWGWGAEDDDMYMRITSAGYEITRPPSYVGRYKMVRHKKRETGACSRRLYAEWQRWRSDGLNSLGKWNLTVLAVSQQALYTNITVDVGKPPSSSHILAASHSQTATDKPPEA